MRGSSMLRLAYFQSMPSAFHKLVQGGGNTYLHWEITTITKIRQSTDINIITKVMNL
jgi:hypothetical protein